MGHCSCTHMSPAGYFGCRKQQVRLKCTIFIIVLDNNDQSSIELPITTDYLCNTTFTMCYYYHIYGIHSALSEHAESSALYMAFDTFGSGKTTFPLYVTSSIPLEI